MQRLRPVDLFVLLVPCSTPVLGLIARNPVGLPHVERLVVEVVVLWVIVSTVTALALWRGADRGSTILTAVVTTFLVTMGDGVVDRYGYGLALLMVLGVIMGVWILASRLRSTSASRVLTSTLIVGLIAGPLIELTSTIPGFGTSSVVEFAPLEVDLGSGPPDIWLVILDGHPGLRAIAQDFEPRHADLLASRLEALGYVLPESAWSSYWTTDYSIPSMLVMSEPLPSVEKSRATSRDLYGIVAGDNTLVHTLNHNGYATYMVESGWSGSTCGRSFDHCVASPWLDESMFLLLDDSLFNNLILQSSGYAFTVGATATMDWVLDNAGRLADDGEPSFVFAHVTVPHPPFLLDSECEFAFDDTRSGLTFQQPNVGEAIRQEYLEEQMACVDGFVAELARRVNEDSVVVVVSDHGTDRRNQLVRDAASWEPAAVVERMNAFVALKGLDECPLEERVIIQNLMAHMLSCVSDTQLATPEPRFHLGPDYVLSEERFIEVTEAVVLGEVSP